jgi:hypothetical protein
VCVAAGGGKLKKSTKKRRRERGMRERENEEESEAALTERKKGTWKREREKVYITSKNQSSLPSYIAKPIASELPSPGIRQVQIRFYKWKKFVDGDVRGWQTIGRRGGWEGRVHRIERGAAS